MRKINSAEWPKALLKNSQVNILKCFIVLILKAQVAMQLSIKSVDARSKKELHRLLKIHYKWFAPLVPRLEIPGSRLHTYCRHTAAVIHWTAENRLFCLGEIFYKSYQFFTVTKVGVVLGDSHEINYRYFSPPT